VKGRVTDADGGGLGDIVILAYTRDTGVWQEAGTTTTDAEGDYVLDLPVGVYRVYFVDLMQIYANTYYDGEIGFDRADNVIVTPNRILNGINATLVAFPAPRIEVKGGVSTGVDRETGQVTVRAGRTSSSRVTLTRVITCPGELTPAGVTLGIGSASFAMTSSDNNRYSVTLTVPDDLPGTGALDMTLRCVCGARQEKVRVGKFELYDPSGQVKDTQGHPIAGAVVNLYRVPDVLLGRHGQVTGCRLDTSTGVVGAELLSAAFGEGVWVNPDLFALGSTQLITPAVNPQITGEDGRYGWNMAEGCWYVVVKAEDYVTDISPLASVPPQVTDLDVVLKASLRLIYLPLVLR